MSSAIRPEGIRIRHVRPRRSPGVSEPGEVQVLDTWFVPQEMRGINGAKGWQKGGYELRLYEEGTFNLTFPNTAGGDGIQHLDRFLCLTAPTYEPGDEWFEVYEHAGDDAPRGQPLAVCTPTKPIVVTTSSIEMSGVDALALQRMTRETTAGFWRNAPRDVFEHYLSAVTAAASDDFEDVTAIAQIDDRYIRTITGTAGVGRIGISPRGGAIRLDYDRNAGSSYTATLETTATVNVGYATGGGEPWRFEVEVELANIGTSDCQIGVGACGFRPQQPQAGAPRWEVNNGSGVTAIVDEGRSSGIIALAVEQRGRWTYFFIDGALVKILPTNPGGAPASGRVFMKGASVNPFVDVRSLLLRRTRPFLLRGAAKGDLRLPGKPAPAGLFGEYFDDTALKDKPNYQDLILGPLAAPYASRVDAFVSFGVDGSTTWQPAGPVGGAFFSARWTGSIYLDLDNFDFAVRTLADDAARVWIGRTRIGEQVTNDWTAAGHGQTYTASTWLKGGSDASAAPSGASGPLAGQRSGWYPVVIEYRGGTAVNVISFDFSRSDAPGTWNVAGVTTGPFTTPAASRVLLSPQGIHSAQVRYDSFYGQLEALRDAFGMQYTCSPRRLESGEFPGQVVPRVREGRDTAYVLDDASGIEAKRDVDAETTIGTLLIDAQGVAVDGAQLTYEQVDFSELRRGGHLMVRSDYESLSDISSRPLLIQRASTDLTLKRSPAEEISCRPTGTRAFVDSFPLAGVLAKFGWAPGDGLRVQLARIRVRDVAPRQILGCSWDLRPAGRASPNVSFRQRPRTLKRELYDLQRVTLNADRNPQGTLVVLNGSIGARGRAGGPDEYSRVSTPGALTQLISATVVVQQYNGGATDGRIEVNGSSTGLLVTQTGRYDVTGYADRYLTEQRMFARLVGGDRTYELSLELLVRVT